MSCKLDPVLGFDASAEATLTCHHEAQLIHAIGGSYLTKIAKSIWTTFSGAGDDAGMLQGAIGMGRLLAKMPVVDLHYDETNKNLFCITDERLFVVQVNK